MLDGWRPLEAKNARRANTLINVLIEFNEFLWEFNFYNALPMKTFKSRSKNAYGCEILRNFLPIKKRLNRR